MTVSDSAERAVPNHGKKPRLTVILGAGSSIPNGGPTSESLTRELEESLSIRSYYKAPDPTKANARPLSERIESLKVFPLVESALATCFPRPDFELVLDALEQLQASAPSFLDGPLAPENRATLSAFLKVKPEVENIIDPITLMQAHQDAIHLLNFVVADATADSPEVQGVDVRGLLEALATTHLLTVISLNYDTVADDANVRWFDGYTCDVDGRYLTFDPSVWNRRKADTNLLMHLHGSIRWGYGDFARSLYEPVKYPSPGDARDSIARGMSASDTVYGHFYGPTPIISGLSKGGKMIYNLRPYGYYYHEAMAAMVAEPRLLIVGYGGRDPHVNELIFEYVRVHGPRRRPVALTRRSGKDVGATSSLRDLFAYLAGRREYRDNIAYDRFHLDYGDGPRLQSHGKLLLVPAGMPLPSIGDLANLRRHWES